MKKFKGMAILLAVTLILGCFSSIAFAEGNTVEEDTTAIVAPEYDSTFNNNKGIFYANGNDITINENASNETVVTWNNGTQVVPTTVTIIGGGKAGTTFDESNITMEKGTVSLIYGGGISLNENSIAKVKESDIKINGGNVLATVYGGGLIYTQVDKSNIKINAGTISAVVGGGCASVVIDGVAYAAGEESNLQASKNRVEETDVEIDGGTIDSTPSNYGIIFGGGQGYSYVGKANIEINNGDLSKAYVTTGGSNGYTREGETKIKGGNIKVLQTVNRGVVESANVKVTGGTILNAYVGGETDDPGVTGKVNKVELDVVGGLVTNLNKGKSNGVELQIDQNNYKAIYVDGTVTNSTIGEKETKIKYTIEPTENDIILIKGQRKEIAVNVKTTPVGYEYLFEDEEKILTSENEEIVKVNEGLQLEAVDIGETTIRIDMLDATQTINANVIINPVFIIFIILLAVVVIAVVMYLIMVL